MGENIFSKSITVLVLISTLLAQQALGQISDNFDDGEFLINPTWSGDVANFNVIDGQLRLNAPDPSPSTGSSVLTLPFSIPDNSNTEWSFHIRHFDFSGSDNNNTRVYLMSTSAVFTGPTDGYYLQFGEVGTEDAVTLFRQTGISSQIILKGTAQQIKDAFQLRIKVTRSASGEWELFVGADVNTLVSAGVAADNTFSASNFFGVRCRYTSSNIHDTYFDEFSIQTTPAPDVSAPQISSITVTSPSGITLNFSETLDTNVPLLPTDFVLNDIVQISSASYAESDDAINLTLEQPMTNGLTQKIHFPSISDLSGNILQSGNHNFLYFEAVAPQPNDIVITEVYPDPSPSLGLPAQEFVELLNRSEHPFQLQNWQITDGSTTGTINTDYILLPNHYVILSSNDGALSYAPFGTTIGLSQFPSLNNSGDNLKLKSPDEAIIDSLAYTLAAYADDDKSGGGYTLERIDPTSFCRGIENWRASDHVLGGTPGEQNSVYHISPDETGPKLLSVTPKAANAITLKFDERLSTAIPSTDNFLFPYPAQKESISFSDENFSEIDLRFSSDLDSATFYTIEVANIFDCPGNILQQDFSSASFKMDMVRPTIVSVTTAMRNKIEIIFSERVVEQSFTAEGISIHNYIGDLTFALSSNEKVLTIDLSSSLENGRVYLLTIENVSDRFENMIESISYNIQFFEPEEIFPRDIVINEFFADPSPVVGLPEAEFIEIFNRSEKAIDVAGWTITDGSANAVLPAKIILPGEFLILCPAGFAASYSTLGSTLGLSSFPSLNNSGDLVKLASSEGITMDSIHYQSSWYADEDKKDGGWTIERINPNDFCQEGENWKASMHESGGTPGQVNSVFELTEDHTPPKIADFSVITSDSVVIHFSERLTNDAARKENFTFDPQPGIDAIAYSTSTQKSIGIRLMDAMDSITTYQLTVAKIADCPANLMQADTIFQFKLDNILPHVLALTTMSQTKLNVRFNEKINVDFLSDENFSIADLQLLEINKLDPFTIELVYSTPFINGLEYVMTISNIPDFAGNLSEVSTHSVLFFEPFPVSPKDLVIAEIFADPTPTFGLPETEFVEIFNRSAHPVQLKNWTFHDDKDTVKLKPYILLPEHYVVLTLSSKAFQYQHSLGVNSFPTLTNSGESLVLKDSTGVTIDSVFYSDDWYRNSEKADGGWSLELIDPDNTCAESENWVASEDPSGGTPGRLNSVDAEKPDLTSPHVVSVIAIAADSLVVSFDEKLNQEIPTVDRFSFEPSLSVDHIFFHDQSKRSYVLKLSSLLENRVRYSITISGIVDCAGNVTALSEKIFFALPETAEPSDVIVNEILFNPTSTGVDFVELYNRSEKFINLKNWTIANLVNDTIVNRKQVSQNDFIFNPADYLVLTADPNVLKGEYLQGVQEKMFTTVLPTFSDDEGSVVILDEREQVIDTVFYSDKQHSPFLKNTEGVSLERVDIHAPSSNTSNWQSASATSGYATPGFQNGSAMQHVFEDAISVQPEIFAPMSGQGFTMIAYNLDHAGYVANVKIVSAHGLVIKEVAENELLGVEGFFTWHGETNSGSKATIGAYMVWFEAFDQNGNVITIKKRVVIADRF